jgi:hypothetical protein
MTDGPYDYAAEQADAARDAWRKGKPLTYVDEALERGYVEGDQP